MVSTISALEKWANFQIDKAWWTLLKVSKELVEAIEELLAFIFEILSYCVSSYWKTGKKISIMQFFKERKKRSSWEIYKSIQLTPVPAETNQTICQNWEDNKEMRCNQH